MDDSKKLASEAAAVNDHHECDDPDCACHQDAGDLSATARRKSP